MALQAHIAELSEKHKKLEEEIHDAMQHPAVDPCHITELKRQKLKVKDELERLRKTVH